MALIRAVQTVNVTHTDSEGSSAALPGQNLPARYLATNYNVMAVVLDDLDTWVAITSGYCDASGIRAASDYTFAFYGRTSNWAWSYGSSVNVPAGAQQFASGTVAVTAGDDGLTGYFKFTFPTLDTSGIAEDAEITTDTLAARGFRNFGQLASFEGEGNTAYIYLSGIGTYAVTDPIYPVPARISIPNIRRLVVDYYPLAIKSGSAWLSCNREGGFVQYISGVDLKNNVYTPGNSTMYNIDGTILPKIGEE